MALLDTLVPKSLLQKDRRVSLLSVSLLGLLSLLATFSPTIHAQDTTVVEIGSITLDVDKVNGPRWKRFDFDPLIDGTHTVRVTWDGTADILFSIFQILDAPRPNDRVRIATTANTATPGEWTGVLDGSEQYFMGVWAASGSASIVATVEAETVGVTPLEITTQPADLTVTEGEDATFTVVASGSGTLGYQWFANGEAIPGATADTVTISATTLADSGSAYSVQVTDDNGSLDSAIATLTVNADEGSTTPEIVMPVPGAQLGGSSVEVTWQLNGYAGVTEWWVRAFWDGGLSDSGRITDPNATSFTLTALPTNGEEINIVLYYRVSGIWENSEFGYIAQGGQLPLQITTQPSDLTVNEGEDATFSVVAAGSGTLSYQWLANGGVIPGATSDTLVVSAVTLADSGFTYSVMVTDDNGSLTSAVATLTVEFTAPTVQIATQPTDQAVTEGENASFTVVASGSGTLSYQWFVDNVAIPGATSDTLSVGITTLSDNGKVYRVEITDDNGSVSSDEATLFVSEIPLPVTVVTVSQGVLDADKVLGPRWVRIDFDALATATHTVTVSWDSDADVKFKVYESDDTLLSPTIKDSNPGVWQGDLDTNKQYYIALWSSSGIASYSATIEANVPVSIQNQPTDLTVTEGDNANFSVLATGSGTLTYQWFADGNPLPGETGDSLTVFATSLIENGTSYTVEVSNGFESVTSTAATLTVNEPVVLGLFSQAADTSAWMLDGPAPTLDYQAGADTDAWGRVLLRVGDMLLVGGDFTGIKPSRNGPVTPRPFLAALNAVSGQPASTFQVPAEVNSVVRSLVLSPDGGQIYVGGDFGLLMLNAQTGALESAVSVADGNAPGRVFDIAVSGPHIYIGGDFLNVSGTYRANIARLFLDGALDSSWSPKVTNGSSAGRAAPVQSIAVSPAGNIVYIGGNFGFIEGTPVDMTPQNRRISMLSVSALDGSVQPERFTANVGTNGKALKVHDMVVTDNYVIIAWGGPNFLSFHSLSGALLRQYKGKGDVQALQIVGDHVFVGHHGEFFGFLPNPIPQEALVSLDPEVIQPFKMHSFRIDDPSFLPEQAWTLLGPFGVWGIAASEDSLWIAGQISLAGSNDHQVDGLVRFPVLLD